MKTFDLEAARRREVQAIGAAISTRSWNGVETAYNDLRDKMDAVLHQPTAVPAISGEGEKLREAVIEAARALVVEPGGLRNNGSALVVVEKADKSDPHYRLCTALERLAALATPDAAPIGSDDAGDAA